MISFKKFLPQVMQDTRWGELAEVWQAIYSDLNTNKAKIIFDQYDYDEISDDNLKDLAILFGFNLKSYTGYTSESYYLKKQLETLIQRIKYKSTPTCYQYQGVPYNLVSNGYSVVYDDAIAKYIADESLIGTSYYGTTYLDRDDKGYQYYLSTVNCDSGLVLDNSPLYYADTMQLVSTDSTSTLDLSYLDTIYFSILDGSELLYNLTRNIVFNYEHKFVENANEFMSINTLKALHNDINQFKRITDRCYFEPYLKIEVNSDKSDTQKIWKDYEGSGLATQHSILIDGSFSNWSTIRLGTGSHTVIDTSITDVDEYLFSIDYIDNTNKIIESSTNYNFRTLITEMQYFSGFTELAIWDTSSGCVLYSTFPTIQWEDTMYSNIKFDFQII
jgi:hypothetical protein